MISWKDRVEMAWGLEQMLGAVFESVSGQVDSEEMFYRRSAKKIQQHFGVRE